MSNDFPLTSAAFLEVQNRYQEEKNRINKDYACKVEQAIEDWNRQQADLNFQFNHAKLKHNKRLRELGDDKEEKLLALKQRLASNMRALRQQLKEGGEQ